MNRRSLWILIRFILILVFASIIFPMFNSYAEVIDNRFAVISPEYDYIIKYKGTNYIVVDPSINAYPSLMYSQIMRYVRLHLKNYTMLNSVNDFYKIKYLNETRVVPMKQYIMAVADELRLKISDVYTFIDEPPIIVLPLYYNDVSIVKTLWSMIRDKAIEYNVVVVVAKRLSPPEYKDKIEYYVNKVVDNRDVFYKNGINIKAIGFGYVARDSVWIDINMTNPSREDVMKVVRLARQLVDDPKIPIVIQFKILSGSTLELRNSSKGAEYLSQQFLLAIILMVVAVSLAIVLRKRSLV